MTAMENVGIVGHLYEGLNAQDTSVARLFAPDVVHHHRLPSTSASREGNVQGMLSRFETFPGWSITIEDAVAERDMVAVRTTQRGTHEGVLFVLSAPGRCVAFSAMAIYRLEGGLISEEWIEVDRLGPMEQIGLPHAPVGSRLELVGLRRLQLLRHEISGGTASHAALPPTECSAD
jgi:predicted ester cyclase